MSKFPPAVEAVFELSKRSVEEELMKRKYVVRVVQLSSEGCDDKPFSGLALEQLRYAGLITWHIRDAEGNDGVVKDVFDIHAPAKVDSKIWAEMNAERMQTFGINAVCAPEWERYDYEEESKS